jgi:glycine/D-amino acid oxidase-like deaminating enzyme
MNQSFWERTSFFDDPDYAIIGAGIVGLFAALTLKQQEPKAKVLVLERGILPDGASTKNAGFACFGSLTELIEQLHQSSETELCDLVGRRIQGLDRLISTIGAEKIQLEKFGGYEIFMPQDEEIYEFSMAQKASMNAVLQDVLKTKEDIFQVQDTNIKSLGLNNVSHLLFNPFEAQIHSGKMMEELLRLCHVAGVRILFNTEVMALDEQQDQIEICTNMHTFKAQKCIVCSNAFSSNLLPQLDSTPGRGQIIITSEIPNLQLQGSFHYDRGYYYFRNVGKRVLIGGGRNLNFVGESTTEFGTTTEIQNALEKMLSETVLHGLDYEIDMRWSGIMAFGAELSPIKKQLSDQLFCAIRCNGMGIALGSQLGVEIAEMAMGCK